MFAKKQKWTDWAAVEKTDAQEFEGGEYFVLTRGSKSCWWGGEAVSYEPSNHGGVKCFHSQSS